MHDGIEAIHPESINNNSKLAVFRRGDIMISPLSGCVYKISLHFFFDFLLPCGLRYLINDDELDNAGIAMLPQIVHLY